MKRVSRVSKRSVDNVLKTLSAFRHEPYRHQEPVVLFNLSRSWNQLGSLFPLRSLVSHSITRLDSIEDISKHSITWRFHKPHVRRPAWKVSHYIVRSVVLAMSSRLRSVTNMADAAERFVGIKWLNTTSLGKNQQLCDGVHIPSFCILQSTVMSQHEKKRRPRSSVSATTMVSKSVLSRDISLNVSF